MQIPRESRSVAHLKQVWLFDEMKNTVCDRYKSQFIYRVLKRLYVAIEIGIELKKRFLGINEQLPHTAMLLV